MPEAFERCVRKLKGKVDNPYAVCTAVNAGNVKEYRKKERAKRLLQKARRAKGVKK